MRFPLSRMQSVAILVLATACSLTATWTLWPQVYHSIRRAERITIYEGLPHPAYEHEVFQEELKTKPTVELSGFPFYRKPLDFKAEDIVKLRGLLGAGSTYSPRSVGHGGLTTEKSCGGFHPDFAVEWPADGKVIRCLICFGCNEARFVNSLGEWYFYDLRSEGTGRHSRMKLRDLLKVYRTHRPPHERFGIGPLAVSSHLSTRVATPGRRRWSRELNWQEASS